MAIKPVPPGSVTKSDEAEGDWFPVYHKEWVLVNGPTSRKELAGKVSFIITLGDGVTVGAVSVTVATEEVAEDPSHETLTMTRRADPRRGDIAGAAATATATEPRPAARRHPTGCRRASGCCRGAGCHRATAATVGRPEPSASGAPALPSEPFQGLTLVGGVLWSRVKRNPAPAAAAGVAA